MPDPGAPINSPSGCASWPSKWAWRCSAATAVGYYNAVDRLYIPGFPVQERAPAGGIAFVSHSGSAFSAMANSGRDFRFSWVISPGQELAVTAADYLRFLVQQPETRVVGLFLESVRDPEGFVEALEQAAAADVPVVVLRVGRSSRGGAWRWRTGGALAGSDVAFCACERWGVLRVDSLDEMGMRWNCWPRRAGCVRGPGPRGRLGRRARHDRGPRGSPGRAVGRAGRGDAGGDRRRRWSRASGRATRSTCGKRQGLGRPATSAASTALALDSTTGATVLAVDLVPGSRLAPDYIDVVLRVQDKTGAPLAVMGNMSSTIDRAFARRLRARGGVPVLMGTDTGLRAPRPRVAAAAGCAGAGPDRARAAAWAPVPGSAGGALDEVTSKQVLRAWGIPTVAEQLVTSEHEAVLAASALGWPVVMKSAAPGDAAQVRCWGCPDAGPGR